MLSTLAAHCKYGRSLFERLMQTGHPVYMFNTQYRMHPAIAHFPSRRFYDGRLENGVGEQERHGVWSNTPECMPYVLLDVPGDENQAVGLLY